MCLLLAPAKHPRGYVDLVGVLVEYPLQVLQVFEHLFISEHFRVDVVVNVEAEGADLLELVLLLHVLMVLLLSVVKEGT